MNPREMAAFHDYVGFCVYCQRHFKAPANWKQHIKTQHPAVWINIAETFGFAPQIMEAFG